MILVSDRDRAHFLADLSRCIGAADAVRKAFEQNGGPRPAWAMIGAVFLVLAAPGLLLTLV